MAGTGDVPAGFLLDGEDVVDPGRRAAVGDQYLAEFGRPFPWDTYDFLACFACDPVSAANAPAGARPAVGAPPTSVAGMFLEARVFLARSEEAETAPYARAMAARARRRPSETVALLALHLRRRDPQVDWVEALRVVLCFVGRHLWPDGRRSVVLPNVGRQGIVALGHTGASRVVAASGDGTLGCWQHGARLMLVGSGRGRVTCFACLHSGQLGGSVVARTVRVARFRPPPPPPHTAAPSA